MSTPTLKKVEHSIEIATDASRIFEALRDVANWPSLFKPTVHAEFLERKETDEVIRLWATANGQLKTWTSHRTINRANREITFEQQVSTAPVAAMIGTWKIDELGSGRALVRLLHEYRAIDDDEDSLAWIDEAVDRNSRSELASLKVTMENISSIGALTFSFEDSDFATGSLAKAYEFINEGEKWADRLPHVQKVIFSEPEPGLQSIEMTTTATDGTEHTTRSFRVASLNDSIHYKQVDLPPLLTMHTGTWMFSASDEGVRMTSRHTVRVREANITKFLGSEATVEDAKNYLRNALGANSRATLRLAKDFVESESD
ncbi:aromatase/cyclase [Glutamicibacter sp. 287]|uniref:aromatase/cyclase n=1 Tax=Glutamicibacter TaxID=1742989 RepID=UPI000BB93167|nr:aromatase/cyclase [Glutamicibacter sp. BW80]PCC27370.1 cyclase [Glutamicibacter sp. BW80]